MKYIAAEVTEVNETNGKVDDNEDMHDGEHPIVATDETVNTMVYEDAHTFHAAVRPPPGECDPESDLPCSCPRRSFAEPQDKLPRATSRPWKAGSEITSKILLLTSAEDNRGQ